MYYRFASEYGFTPAEVNEIPMYLACLMLGAMSPDHEGIRMHPDDVARYFGKAKRKHGR